MSGDARTGKPEDGPVRGTPVSRTDARFYKYVECGIYCIDWAVSKVTVVYGAENDIQESREGKCRATGLEPEEDELAFTSVGFGPTNRAKVHLGGLTLSADEPAEFFIALRLSEDTPSGHYIGIGAVTYKDLVVYSPNFVYHTNLPQFTDLKGTV